MTDTDYLKSRGWVPTSDTNEWWRDPEDGHSSGEEIDTFGSLVIQHARDAKERRAHLVTLAAGVITSARESEHESGMGPAEIVERAHEIYRLLFDEGVTP